MGGDCPTHTPYPAIILGQHYVKHERLSESHFPLSTQASNLALGMLQPWLSILFNNLGIAFLDKIGLRRFRR
ncbi:MAG: hypothetical protein QXK72_07530, partial [Candidatus Bathyarchaeia archaeon]